MIPKVPVKAQGMRIEPPASLPWCSTPRFSEAAAAAPPEEPPAVMRVSQGLRVMPYSGLSVTPFQPNSGVVVLPSSTAPALRIKAEKGASTSQGPVPEVVFEPLRVGMPRVRVRSLIDAGTPSSAPHGWPLNQRCSEARAASSAPCGSTWQ
ncbi:hypothetical protein D3C87_1616910 [compost metagenome]